MKITYKQIPGKFNRVQLFIDGKPFGDILDDNSYIDDGFRFHDLYHISLYLLYDYKCGVYGTLIGESKPNKYINKIEESLVLFMFTLGKNYSIDNPNTIIYSTILDIMKNQIRLNIDEKILVKYIYYMYDLIQSLTKLNNNNCDIELILTKETLLENLVK